MTEMKTFEQLSDEAGRQLVAKGHLVSAKLEELESAMILRNDQLIEKVREQLIMIYEAYVDAHIFNSKLKYDPPPSQNHSNIPQDPTG
jgi:hypothetical protein